MKRVYCLALLILSLAMTTAAPAFASTNLVVNGDFENVPLSKSWDTFSTLAGWTLNSGEVEIQRNLYGGNPTKYVELDGTHNDVISQNLNLVKGTTYTLSFDYLYRPDANKYEDSASMTVSFGSLANPFKTVVANTIANDWATYTSTFLYTGDTGQVTLALAGGGKSDSYGALVDNVSVTPKNATPIPGAVWLLGSGLLGLVGLRRKLS